MLGAAQGVYLAGVHQGNAIVVSQNDIYALNLTDGLRSWRTPPLSATPSGRGVIMNGVLMQPLTNSTIQAIDLTTGQMLAEPKLANGFIAGNLTAANGWVITQTATAVHAFMNTAQTEQEIQQQLAKDESSPSALLLRGQLKLLSGNTLAGINDLTTSYKSTPNDRTRELLINILLSGMEADFATYQSRNDFLHDLIEEDNNPDHRIRFLQAQGRGLAQTNPDHAFDVLLELLLLTTDNQSLVPQPGGWRARNLNAILGQIIDLIDNQPEQKSLTLHQKFTQWLFDTTQTHQELALQCIQFLAPSHIDEPNALKLINIVASTQTSPLQKSLLLETFERHPSPIIQAHALAEHILFDAQMGNIQLAHQRLQQLKKFPHNLSLRPGRTIANLIAETQNHQLLSENTSPNLQWPPELEKISNASTSVASGPVFPIPHFGPPSPDLAGWSFYIEGAGHDVILVDPDGVHKKHIETHIAQRRTATGAAMARYVTSIGSKAYIVLTDRLLMVDIRDTNLHDELPYRQLIPSEDDPFSLPGRAMPGVRPVRRLRVPITQNASSNLAGNVSIAKPHLICHGIDDRVVAIDPITNAELWIQEGVPQGAELLVDGNHVIILPPDGSPTTILRAVDGKRLASIPTPENISPDGWKRADWGRLIPTETTDSEKQSWTFALFDPITNKNIWENTLPLGSIWAPVDDSDIAFLQPNGQLTLCNSQTGQPFSTINIPTNTPVKNIRLLNFADHWILLTNDADDSNMESRARFFIPVESQFHVQGKIIAINRNSQQIDWAKDIPSADIQLDYPRNWPVLLMVQSENNKKANQPPIFQQGSIQILAQQKVALVALNRTTGNEIARVDTPNNTYQRWAGKGAPEFQIAFRMGIAQLFLGPPGSANAPQKAAPKQIE